MKVLKSEKKEKGIIEVVLEVDSAQYDVAAGKAFAKNKNRVSVPGFRKGKAPRKVVERMYGKDVFLNDSLEILYPDLLNVLKEEQIYKIVDQPHITDINFNEEAGGLSVTLNFSVYPEVTIGEYKGLTAPRESYDVPEIEIDNDVAAIRVRNARIESVDRPAKDGDTVIIDFEGFINGETFEGGKSENYELELGSNSFIPGFEEKICGMEIGETREIDLVFPEQYAEHLAGKPVVFKVKLNEVKEKLLPDIDDEFAKDISEFDTMAEYKADVRQKLEKARKAKVDDAFEAKLMDKLIENLDAEIPESMVEDQIDLAMRNMTRQLSAYNMDPASYLKMMGMTPENFRESSRPGSEKQVKISLALEKIAELENIEVTDEDIEKEYAEAAEELKKDIEELKKNVDKENLVHDLKLRAAAKLVVDNAIPEAIEGDKSVENKPKKEKKKPSTTKSKDKGDES